MGRVAATKLGLCVGLALCAVVCGRPHAGSEAVPRIHARITTLGAFFVESLDKIEDADRIEVGGDFTFGNRTTAVKPDAEALAVANPVLFERLAALGRMRAKFLVDRAGEVHRVRFEGGVDADLQKPFLDVLDVARFEPTTHFERGPVILERQVDYFVSLTSPSQSAPLASEMAESTVDVEEVSRRLADVYGLPEGRHLDLRPPPYPPERLALYRALSPSQARAIPSGPTLMSMVWRDGRLAIEGSCFGCDDLISW